MNRDPETPKRSDAIRQEIDQTRHRMDQTIDALTDRFKGRHLLDEAIGYARSHADDERVEKITTQISQTTNSAVKNIVNSVKSNPWPAVLIGAGVAWMLYSSRRNSTDQSSWGDDDDGVSSDADVSYSSVEYISGAEDDLQPDFSGNQNSGQTNGSLRQKAEQAKDRIRDVAGQVGEKVRQGSQALRERASEVGSQVQDGTRRAYERSREVVTSTVKEHPIEVGLGILAVGVAVGLSLPTPNKVNEIVGPRVDGLRDKAKEAGRNFVQRGKSVAQAAARAAREEARAQGFSEGQDNVPSNIEGPADEAARDNRAPTENWHA